MICWTKGECRPPSLERKEKVGYLIMRLNNSLFMNNFLVLCLNPPLGEIQDLHRWSGDVLMGSCVIVLYKSYKGEIFKKCQ